MNHYTGYEDGNGNKIQAGDALMTVCRRSAVVDHEVYWGITFVEYDEEKKEFSYDSWEPNNDDSSAFQYQLIRKIGNVETHPDLHELKEAREMVGRLNKRERAITDKYDGQLRVTESFIF